VAKTVFTRNWWRYDRDQATGRRVKVPDCSAHKTIIAIVPSVDEARKMCEQWNKANKPGPLGRKAEFTSNFSTS